MKKASDVFKSIRFAKGEPRDKPHSSTDDEAHYTVGEKEYEQQVKHVKKMAMQEEKKDKYDEGEYDREGDMAKSDLRSIIDNAKRLHDMIDDADNLPEWVQSKITLAEDYISTVTNYMTSEMSEEVVAEEAEYLEEKNAPTNPALWSRAKALARSKFDVYPSAYANGWAAKWYKSKGGGWKTVSEEVEQIDEVATYDEYLKKYANSKSKKKLMTRTDFKTWQKHNEYWKSLPKKNGIVTGPAPDKPKKKVAEEVVSEAAQIGVGSKVYHPIHGSGKVLKHSTGAGADHWAEVKFLSGNTKRVNRKHLKLEEVVVEGAVDHSALGKHHEKMTDQELRKVGSKLPNSWDAAAFRRKLASHPKYAQALKHYDKSEYHFGKAARQANKKVTEGMDYSVTVKHTKDGNTTDHEYTVKNANDKRHAKNIALQRHEKKIGGLKDSEQISASSNHVKELRSEEIEYIEEMPGANMDTRAVHAHLKKQGWSLSRTSGGHDVYTHPDAEHHIAVPRHRQLKAPLVKGILKQSIVREEEEIQEAMKNTPPFAGPYKKDTGTVVDKSGAKHTAMSKVRDLARQAMKKQSDNLKKPRVEEEKETELSNKSKIVRNALKDGKKKLETSGGKDKFESDPELTSQIVKT